jgi:hypothetical protein
MVTTPLPVKIAPRMAQDSDKIAVEVGHEQILESTIRIDSRSV